MCPAIAFELALEHGFCVAVHLPDAPAETDALAAVSLAPEERALAAAMTAVRRRTWVGGRAAMRMALERAAIAAAPVVADDRGAPILPSGVTGSISHKETLAAALVAREPRARVGVDIEADTSRAVDISARVLHDDELQEIAHLAPADRQREVLLRFSAKEAIYKALDPFVRRYVDFREVSVSPGPDGTARVRHRLREGIAFAIDVRWRRLQGIVLTTARVERTAGP
jgi:4'-phosphopantetheinyl transferase EntD